MKLVGLCSIAVVLGSMTLLAQSTARALPSQPTVAIVMPGSTNCPVDMSAQKGLSGQFLQVRVNGQQDPGPSQNLQLKLTNSSFSEIVGVRVTAYGLNAKGQVTPANATIADSSALQKSFDLNLKVNPKSTGSVDLVLTGFTSVMFLSVDSIRYAGGSAWHSTAERTCRVVPNGVMLITSR